MSYEVECGECGEQILIEDLGVEVACPHCETVLVLNAEDVEETSERSAEVESEGPAEEQQAFDFNFSDTSQQQQEENGSDSGVASAILTKEEVDRAQPPDEDEPDQPTESEPPNFGFLNQSNVEDEETPQQDETPNFNFTQSADSNEEETSEAPAFSIDTSAPSTEATQEKTEEARIEEQSASESDEESAASKEDDSKKSQDETTVAKPLSDTGGYTRRPRGPNPKVFQFLVSYSILITIAFLYLFFSFFQAKPHQLESLPDVAPPKEGEFRLIRENASLAPGHTLEIGETQRFGHIEITPLAVVRGPLEFEHFQGGLGTEIPPTQPVLKLELKIKNVSDDQVFPPLDLDLITIREHDPENYDLVHANTWIARESDLSHRKNRILMYNHPPTSEYDIKGLVTRPLNPGEEVETFIPSQEANLGQLEGDLVWRLQIRKGFHPVSMNGVTTLVDVKFSADKVERESA